MGSFDICNFNILGSDKVRQTELNEIFSHPLLLDHSAKFRVQSLHSFRSEHLLTMILHDFKTGLEHRAVDLLRVLLE